MHANKKKPTINKTSRLLAIKKTLNVPIYERFPKEIMHRDELKAQIEVDVMHEQACKDPDSAYPPFCPKINKIKDDKRNADVSFFDKQLQWQQNK